MLQINFYPDYDNPEFVDACDEYKNIWEDEKERIIKVFKDVSGLEFKEKIINAIVFNGRSHSHPLSLRYDLDNKFKKANLVHELGHRLLYGNKVFVDGGPRNPNFPLESHKNLDLILYDVLYNLYGEEYSKEVVAFESDIDRPDFYKDAWEWALSLSKEERRDKFKELLNN